ncbi:MAG: hypothetical protein IOD12_08715 [Silvanigrellales bacterium]|jgi:hypothetical protein|nr:hypothetical protein [Silvanigrellales bacterium]
MTENRTSASQLRSRKRHQFREAENTLEYIIEQIESGYDFKDEFGPRLLGELRKICVFLRREYDEITETGEHDGNE